MSSSVARRARESIAPVAFSAVPNTQMDLRSSRRQLIVDGVGLLVSIIGFGLVFGLAARSAGYSPIEAASMSLIVFAGASQFAAVGYVVAGFPWILIAVFTAFLNSRHFLYAAALAPYLADKPRPLRAFMAHFLTDEAFALSIAHFRRIGRGDLFGYFWAALVVVYIPWNLATLAGVLIGGTIPDPRILGLDVIFPAAFAGMAVGLIEGRRDLVAAVAGIAIGVTVGLAFDTAAGIICGGLFGPLVAMVAVKTPARRLAA